VSWCDRPATGYGAFCKTHKGRDRKHGHPEQMTITAAKAIVKLAPRGAVQIAQALQDELGLGMEEDGDVDF
jgi:hypothetical protein